MARKNSTAASDEELEEDASEIAARARSAADSPLDARMLDLDDEAESPFLRGQKRVPVRRGALPRRAADHVRIALLLLLTAVGIALIWVPVERYATRSWRFRLQSSDNISVSGTHNVSRSQVLEVLAGDIDRNIFFVPLEQRKKELEQIPWVQSASVIRLLPSRLKVVIRERTPVAFVEIDSHIGLIDAGGVIMETPPGSAARYSFPVIVGMSESDPLSTRAARMKIYMQFMTELDSGGARYSADISDVDLDDPDDVKVTVADPQGAVLVHLGSSNFRQHFQIYVAHVQEWRTQFQRLESVNLRFDHQVIVNPEPPGDEQAAGSHAAAGAAPEPRPAAHSRPVRRTKKHT
ncbi:MAG TPA: FtsQ-type POTRA domain-containing protein [Candidatus Binatia bacterium]|nr:FtsQ-type POTRA domain-containing protein [Candidatus Binatia bacterium]